MNTKTIVCDTLWCVGFVLIFSFDWRLALGLSLMWPALVNDLTPEAKQ